MKEYGIPEAQPLWMEDSKIVAREAHRVYTLNELRQRDDTFDHHESFSSTILGAISANANKIIREKGRIAIIDFPDQRDSLRVQVVSRHEYLRIKAPLNHIPHSVEERVQSSGFSISLASLKGEVGGINLDVKQDAIPNKTKIFRTGWNEDQNPMRRIAILSFNTMRWDVLLDFNIDQFEGQPMWKVNKYVPQDYAFYKAA